MEMEEEKEAILKLLGDSVRKVYGEWCNRGNQASTSQLGTGNSTSQLGTGNSTSQLGTGNSTSQLGTGNAVQPSSIEAVVTGVDNALSHGLRRPNQGYWPLLVSLLDHDTRSHLLLNPCPKARGWYWVLRCLSQGELEALITVVLSHLNLLPPLYLPHALLLDPSAQLVLPTLLAGLEHVALPKMIEEELKPPPDDKFKVTPKLLTRVRSSISNNFRKQSSLDSSGQTAPESAQFVLNVSQPSFPALQSTSNVPSFGIPRDYAQQPIEDCTEATEALNGQAFDDLEEAEKYIEIHHFGKKKKKSGGSRGGSSSERRKKEAQEMSLEDELLAATGGDFDENRPPVSSDPDLIMGILSDDKLVKVLPDVSTQEDFPADDIDVEIIEVFSPTKATEKKFENAIKIPKSSEKKNKESAAAEAKKKDVTKLSSQEQLTEARQIIKSLTIKGVLKQTPELNKLMEVFAQKEALLSERTPPEGQEDPPFLGAPHANHLSNQPFEDESSEGECDMEIDNEDLSLVTEDETAAEEVSVDETEDISCSATEDDTERTNSSSSSSTSLIREESEEGREAGVGTTSSDEMTEDLSSVTEEALPAPPFDRRIPQMEDSLYDEEVLEPEALTEGCREKTSIVGGNKWDELMAGKDKMKSHTKDLRSPLKSSTPKSDGFKRRSLHIDDSSADLYPEGGTKHVSSAGITRTQSLSSCGSKLETRSDSKLNTLHSSKLDYKLDSNSESVVAALDDAAREAQLQLLNLHTQLQHYRKMAARRKYRREIDAKLKPALKYRVLGLYRPVHLEGTAPQGAYPLSHDYLSCDNCAECEEEKKLSLAAEYEHSQLLSNPEAAANNTLTSTILRRPGETLYRVFIMREGHVRGRASTVRVVLSSHALYVLNTCPAPALLHALPYTQIHTVVIGAFGEWVVVVSKSVVESGTVTPANRRDMPCVTNKGYMGVQLCVADKAVTDQFVSCLEIQTRRSLMNVYINSDGSRLNTLSGEKNHHSGLTDVIEQAVPCVIEDRDWETRVLQQWIHYLIPSEPACNIVCSWLVEWDRGEGGLANKSLLSPTMEGTLMFRTNKLLSTWKNSHFLLKAGVLYQFWCSGDRLPHTMLDVTSCTGCSLIVQNNKQQHSFQVTQSDGLPLLLAAPDSEQAGRWIRAINAVISNANGEPQSRRPTPCRLLLLPHSIVLIHQTDLLLASPNISHSSATSILEEQDSGQRMTASSQPSSKRNSTILSPNAALPFENNMSPTVETNPSVMVNSLKQSKHLSTSLSSLNSSTSSKAPVPSSSSSVVTNQSCPPRSLSLKTDGSRGSSVLPKLSLNKSAEARVLSRIDLKKLSGIGRYNECSNTLVLEIQSPPQKESVRRGSTQSTTPCDAPAGGNWNLYFRGSEQLEHFLKALAGQTIVCEKQVSDTNLQQLLLEGALASAGGWAALTSTELESPQKTK